MNGFQGALFINSCCITNTDQVAVDVTDISINIKIFEDINQPFLSGRITLVDGVNLLKNYKFTGQESITIDVSQAIIKEGKIAKATKANSIRHTFRIYSITDVNRNYQNSYQTYVLHFCDPRKILCDRKKISQVMRNSYSEMLLQTLQQQADFKELPESGTDYWDESEPQHMQLVVPNWTLSKFIQFIVNNAEYKGNKSWKQSMFFYQSMNKGENMDNGGFRFSSFQSMMRREFPKQFNYAFYNEENANPVIDENMDSETMSLGLDTQILAMYTPQRVNTMHGYNNGAYAGTVRAFDPVRKVLEESTYSIDDVFKTNEKQTHVSGFPMIRRQFETTYESDFSPHDGEPETKSIHESPLPETVDGQIEYIDYRVSMTNAYSDEPKLIDSGNKKIIQQIGMEYRDANHLERQALLSFMDQSTMRMKIPFRSDISVGTCIQVNIPEPEQMMQDGVTPESDVAYDGKYLITRIAYGIDAARGRGVLDIECVKESLGVDLKTENDYTKLFDGAKLAYDWEENPAKLKLEGDDKF